MSQDLENMEAEEVVVVQPLIVCREVKNGLDQEMYGCTGSTSYIDPIKTNNYTAFINPAGFVVHNLIQSNIH